MSNEIIRQLNNTKFILQRQDEQSKALQSMIDDVYNMHDEMAEMNKSNAKMHDDMFEMKEATDKAIEELRNSITLNRHEQSQMKSIAGKKAYELAKNLFGERKVSNDLVLSKSGHLRSAIYKKVNETFDAPRYVDIRRVNYKEAISMIINMELGDFKPYQLRLTKRQKEIAEANHDDISGLV